MYVVGWGGWVGNKCTCVGAPVVAVYLDVLATVPHGAVHVRAVGVFDV